jgi:hypothetical protein
MVSWFHAPVTDLLRIRVESREGAAVVLRVRMLPAEQGPFCVSHAFAWMLVDPHQNEYDFRDIPAERLRAANDARDAIGDAHPDAGGEEIARLTIPELSITDVRNYREERPLGRDDVELPEALYRLRFANEALAAHLDAGLEWSSTAWDEANTGLFLAYPGEAS